MVPAAVSDRTSAEVTPAAAQSTLAFEIVDGLATAIHCVPKTGCITKVKDAQEKQCTVATEQRNNGRSQGGSTIMHDDVPALSAGEMKCGVGFKPNDLSLDTCTCDTIRK